MVSQALDENPSIQKVERRIEFAKQNATIARSRLFPLVFFDADETWQYLSRNGLYRQFNPRIPLNANLVDLTISFTYELDFWGKNMHLFRAALGEAMADEAEYAQVQLITTTAVAQAYFALKINLLKKNLYKNLYEVKNNIFQLQSLLQDKALFDKLPLFLAEEDVLEVEKMLLGIEKEIETDKHPKSIF